MKKIGILGSTGSIGTQTLEVVRNNRGDFDVVALTAGNNIEEMAAQIREFHPHYAVMKNEERAEALADILSAEDISCEILYGMDGFVHVSTLAEVEIVVAAMVGMIGLRPVMRAIEAGKDIALANKETLVTAGHIIMPLAARHQVRILPVDSEHSAIFQCLTGRERTELYRILLTGSGGPFRGKPVSELRDITPAQAVKHPNWSMGAKISVDSATMMNKGLEFIEAIRLFRVSPGQVDVVIHRQSIIHSMVEFRDGAVLAQMGTPDMRLPIRYAMTYPQRAESEAEPLNLLSCPPLTFAEPDRGTFPCLRLAEVAAAKGGTACAVLNAANEEAVRLFLEDRIGFRDIFDLTARAMTELPVVHKPSLPDILEADAAARREVLKNVSR